MKKVVFKKNTQLIMLCCIILLSLFIVNHVYTTYSPKYCRLEPSQFLLNNITISEDQRTYVANNGDPQIIVELPQFEYVKNIKINYTVSSSSSDNLKVYFTDYLNDFSEENSISCSNSNIEGKKIIDINNYASKIRIDPSDCAGHCFTLSSIEVNPINSFLKNSIAIFISFLLWGLINRVKELPRTVTRLVNIRRAQMHTHLYEKKPTIFIFLALSIIVPISLCQLGKLLCDDEKSIIWNQFRNIDLVFVGSSHVYRGIIPQKIYDDTGLTAGNLATSNQTLGGSYWLLKEYFKKNHDIANIIFVDVAPAADSPRNAFAVRYLSGINKIQACNDLKYNYFSFEEGYNFISFHQNNDLSKSDFSYLTNSGLISADKWYTGMLSSELALPSEEVNAIQANTAQIYNYENKLDYIRKIIDLAHENNATLVLLCAPYITTIEERKFLDQVSEIATQDKIPFLDYCKW